MTSPKAVKMIQKILLSLLLIVTMRGISNAQEISFNQAETLIKAKLLDPSSFTVVREGTYTTKKIQDAIFIEFRSKTVAGNDALGCGMVGNYKNKTMVNVYDAMSFAGIDICTETIKRVNWKQQ